MCVEKIVYCVGGFVCFECVELLVYEVVGVGCVVVVDVGVL